MSYLVLLPEAGECGMRTVVRGLEAVLPVIAVHTAAEQIDTVVRAVLVTEQLGHLTDAVNGSGEGKEQTRTDTGRLDELGYGATGDPLTNTILVHGATRAHSRARG